MASPFKDFTVHLEKDEVVFQEGEPGTIMYVIQSGAVELFRDVDGRRISYGLLEKGDFFGEMSLLLESQPRTTSAVVAEPVKATTSWHVSWSSRSPVPPAISCKVPSGSRPLSSIIRTQASVT